jgi:hypothetical protein
VAAAAVVAVEVVTAAAVGAVAVVVGSGGAEKDATPVTAVVVEAPSVGREDAEDGAVTQRVHVAVGGVNPRHDDTIQLQGRGRAGHVLPGTDTSLQDLSTPSNNAWWVDMSL